MSGRLVAVFTPFENLTDPRVERTRVHDLFELVVVALCGTLAGADTWTDIERFGNDRLTWLRTFLRLEGGIPSHDTFGRVFAMLDPAELVACIRQWLADVGREIGTHIAIDGKTLRGSGDKAAARNPLHLVSAWASEARLTLGQVAVDSKSNEITAIPALLQLLELKGCIVTIDAMGCQKAIAQTIIKQEADYVLTLKANHGLLYEEVERFFAWARQRQFADVSHAEYHTVDGTHGRGEERHYWLVSDLTWLTAKREWVGLQSVGMVERERTVAGKTTIEVHYYLTSLTGSGQQFGEAVRTHWSVENGLHWVLDVAFQEDQSRLRRDSAAENVAVLRHLALSLLRQESTCTNGIKVKRLKAALDENYLARVLLA